MKKVITFALAVLGVSQASAQSTVYWPAPLKGESALQTALFPMGTGLTLVTRTQISTKDNKPGDRFYLEVAESLSYQGQIVIPAGSSAVGEVVRSDRNGHFGKKGKLDIRLLYVETPSGPVRLSGQAWDEGTSGTIASFATIALVSGLGFVIHGTSAHIPFGTVVNAHLAEPMRFVIQKQAAVAENVARPDHEILPARFDPSVFGGFKRQTASR